MYKRIGDLCAKNGITIAKLCKDVGISNSTFTELKSGRTKQLSVSNASKVAEYFNVSVEYLMGLTEQKKPLVNNDEELTDYLQELKDREEMRMLFSVTKTCTKEEVEQAVRIIEALRKEK